MQRTGLKAAGAGVALALVAVLTACGSEGKRSSASDQASVGVGAVQPGKPGGRLTVLFDGDVDYLDPGSTYSQPAFMMTLATQRPLYQYPPGKYTEEPDLAAGPPAISPDGRKLTVSIRPNVRFSPPYNRTVRSQDVRYAIERTALPKLSNGYASSYFSDLVGWDAAAQGKAVRGISTPDSKTIVFELTRPVARRFYASLVLPATAPVPAEVARRLDAQKAADAYGNRQAFTGPYMIENDRSTGRVSGYQPGQQIRLVRNPNWQRATDVRPAYLDSIVMSEGNTDTTVATRRILTGRSLVNGDFSPGASDLKPALQQHRKQTAMTDTGGWRYVALNTKIPPFNNINLRKAVVAGSDRNALRLTRGGAAVGAVATHFIAPNFPGFQDAGGVAGPTGPEFDFVRSLAGNADVARKYLRAAGYPNGRYMGKEQILMVADNSAPGSQTAQVVLGQLQAMGFNVKLRQVDHSTMQTKFCGVPKANVQICPNVGWTKDFYDPSQLFLPTFYGPAIVPSGNTNWPQLAVATIDEAMVRADAVVDPTRRARAWATVDRLVTAQAPGIPYLWEKAANIESTNVQGVISTYNATWDVSYTSLK